MPVPAPPPPIHVVVDEGGGCLDAPAFERSFFARSKRTRGAGAPGDATLHVRVRGAAAPYHGVVRLEVPGDEAHERTLEGKTCEDVAHALVLVATLLSDADADEGESATGSIGASIRIDVSDRPPSDAPAEPEPEEPAPVVRRFPFVARVGVQGAAGFAGGEGPSPSAGLVFDLERRGGTFLRGLRAGVAYDEGRFSRAPASIFVRSVHGRLEPVVVRGSDGPFSYRAYVALEAGATFAEATGPLVGTPRSRPSFRTGAGVRAEVRMFGPLACEFDLGATVPWIRDAYVVESPPVTGSSAPVPGERVAEPSPVVPYARAGMLAVF
ncbi:MAG: hypothetical protein U0169_12745 [Polyangiaceae bacterium]